MNPQKDPLPWSGEGEPPPLVWLAHPQQPSTRHRGNIYPSLFTWTWTREDGFEVILTVEVQAAAGPVPVAVTMRSVGGIEGSDYRQPIPSMTRTAAAQYALQVSVTGPESFEIRPVDAGRVIPMGRITGKTDNERLERIAVLYRRALSEDRGVTELIEASESVGRAHAYGLIRQARQAGLLPPSRPGRKAKTESRSSSKGGSSTP